jgi:hypothetical protein
MSDLGELFDPDFTGQLVPARDNSIRVRMVSLLGGATSAAQRRGGVPNNFIAVLIGVLRIAI